MKKNNTLKKAMAGALAMVSVAAYMPVSAVVPVIGNVAIEANAEDVTEYKSGERVEAQNLKVGDILNAGAVIERCSTPRPSGIVANYLYVFVNGKAVTKGYYDPYSIPDGEKCRVSDVFRDYSAQASDKNYDYAVYLTVSKAKVTLPEGAKIENQTAEEGNVYKLDAGTYTITSDVTLVENHEKLTLSAPTEVDEKYQYTLTVSEFGESFEAEIEHAHTLKFINKLVDSDDKSKLYLRCKGEKKFVDQTVAELNIAEEYFYGECPTKTDLKIVMDEETYASYGIENIAASDVTFVKKGTSISVNPEDFELGGEYTANGRVTVTIDGDDATYAVEQDFKYSKRPIYACDFYEVKGIDTESGELVLGDKLIVNGNVVSGVSFEYDKTEKSPIIAIVNPSTDDIVDYIVTDDEDNVTESEDVGSYSFKVTPAEEEENYTDDATIQWSITTASATLSMTAKKKVYDGKPLGISDFTFTGEAVEDGIFADSETTYGFTFSDGDGINAGTGTATLSITNPNYVPIFATATYEIDKRPVALTPAEGQSHTYGMALSPDSKVDYDVEEQSGDRGFIASDLEALNKDLGEDDKLTEQDFFGNQFLIDMSESGKDFAYGSISNDAGEYSFKPNKEENFNAAGNIDNYDIEWNCVEFDTMDPTVVYTIAPKELTADMFSFWNGNVFTYYETDGEGAEQTPLLHNGFTPLNGVCHFGIDIAENLYVDEDYTIDGTTDAIFPGLFHVEVEGKGNYTGFVSLPWTIIENEGYGFTVTADDFIYDGKPIEEHEGHLTISKPFGLPNTDVADMKLDFSDDDYKVTYSKVISKNDSEDENDWEFELLEDSPTEPGEYRVDVAVVRKGYNIDPKHDYFTIAAQGIEITPTTSSKVFGEVDPEIKYTYTPVGNYFEGKDVTIEGKIKIGNKIKANADDPAEAYAGNAGEYEYDLSDLKVYVDGVEDTGFAVNVPQGSKFTVKRRRIKDSDIVAESRLFDESGMIYVPATFEVWSVDANGEPCKLTRGTDFRLVTGERTKVENGQFSIQVAGLGNYTGAADSVIRVENSCRVAVKNGTIVNKSAEGETEGEFFKKDQVTVKADAPADGMKFAYWLRDGQRVSQNEQYTIVVSSPETELEAVYTENTDDIARYGSAVMSSVETIDGSKLRFTATLQAPEGAKALRAGLIAANNLDKFRDLTINSESDANSGVYIKVTDKDKDGNPLGRDVSYNWNKTGVGEGDTWYVKPVIEYQDEKTGKITVIYGDAYEASLNSGLEKVAKAEVLSTAYATFNGVIEDTGDGKGNKLSFTANLEVPPECKILEAGLYAVSDENLVAEFVADYVFGSENAVPEGGLLKLADVSAKNTHQVQYNWTKTKVAEDDFWFVTPLVVYMDADGEVYSKFGETVVGSMSNLDDVPDDDNRV